MTDKASKQKLTVNIPAATKQIDSIGYLLDNATMTRFSKITGLDSGN